MAGQADRETTTPAIERRVARIVRGQAASDGAGVKLTRVIGSRALPDLDPFLLLDEFRSNDPDDYIAGFPAHPHRGFETVTYMLAGRMRHGDNQGNQGLLGPGSVQWMTAGRGIVHSEFPEQQEGLMWGFQLWVNLPSTDKMTAPRYQDIQADQIPEHDSVLVPKPRARQHDGCVVRIFEMNGDARRNELGIARLELECCIDTRAQIDTGGTRGRVLRQRIVAADAWIEDADFESAPRRGGMGSGPVSEWHEWRIGS